MSTADIIAIVTLTITLAAGLAQLLATRDQLRSAVAVVIARTRRITIAHSHALAFAAAGIMVLAALQLLGAASPLVIVAIAAGLTTAWFAWAVVNALPRAFAASYRPSSSGGIRCVPYQDGSATALVSADGTALTTDVGGGEPYVYFSLDRPLARQMRRAPSVAFVVEFATDAPAPPRLEYDSRTLKYKRRDLQTVGTRGEGEWQSGLVLVADARFAARQQESSARADFRLSCRLEKDYDLRVKRVVVMGLNV